MVAFKDPEQAGLWKSTVTLSEHFFNEVIDRPVPIDMRAIKALEAVSYGAGHLYLADLPGQLPEATDSHPWASLALQFGSDYSRLRDFKHAFIDELKKVVLVYGQVQVEVMEDGLVVKPSLTHISKKGNP